MQRARKTSPGATTNYASSSWHSSAFQTIVFTQEAGDTYSLSFNGTSITNANRNLSASDISQIRLFNFNAGSGANFDQYFNSLEVTAVPEPSASAYALLCGLIGLGLVLRRTCQATKATHAAVGD